MRHACLLLIVACGGATHEVAEPQPEPRSTAAEVAEPVEAAPVPPPPPAEGPVEVTMEQVVPGPFGPWDYGVLGEGPELTIALTPIGGGRAMLGTRGADEWSFSELGTNLTVRRLWEDSALARQLNIMSDASDVLLVRSDGTVVHRHDCPFGTSREDGLAMEDGWLLAFRCGDAMEVGRVGDEGGWRSIGTLRDVLGVQAGTDALAFFRRDGETLAIDVLPADADSLGALERSPVQPARPTLAPTMLVDDQRRVHYFERAMNDTIWRRADGSTTLTRFLEVGAALDEGGRPVLVGRDETEDLKVWWWRGDEWRKESFEPPADADFWVRGMRVEGHVLHLSFAITRSARESHYARLVFR